MIEMKLVDAVFDELPVELSALSFERHLDDVAKLVFHSDSGGGGFSDALGEGFDDGEKSGVLFAEMLDLLL